LKKAGTGKTHKNAEEMWKFEQEHAIPHHIKLSAVTQEVEARGKVGIKINEDLGHLNTPDLVQYQSMYYKFMEQSSRFEMVKIHGVDVKFLYHVLRLIDESEQVILEGTINLQRAKEAMKSIRRGEWTLEDMHRWVMEKEIALEAAYVNCKLPEEPPEKPLHALLLNCLEAHFGSLDKCVQKVGVAEDALRNIDQILEQIRPHLYR
jgi:hypothetical protein